MSAPDPEMAKRISKTLAASKTDLAATTWTVPTPPVPASMRPSKKRLVVPFDIPLSERDRFLCHNLPANSVAIRLEISALSAGGAVIALVGEHGAQQHHRIPASELDELVGAKKTSAPEIHNEMRRDRQLFVELMDLIAEDPWLSSTAIAMLIPKPNEVVEEGFAETEEFAPRATTNPIEGYGSW